MAATPSFPSPTTDRSASRNASGSCHEGKWFEACNHTTERWRASSRSRYSTSRVAVL